MKKVLFYIICIFMLIPTVVLAAGIELEFIEPSYDVSQVTYIQDPEKPLVFNFTFTPESKEMKYRIKLTNTEQKAFYITDIDHTTDNNVVISYDGIKKADVLQPGESKYVNIKFEMKTFPTTEYSNEIKFYFRYDLAENHVENREDPTDPNRRNSNRIDENPATGILNVVVIVVPFIIVLSVAYLLINKKNILFKHFVFLLVPLTAGLIINNVFADKTEGTVVISGNLTFKEIPNSGGGDPTDPENPDDPENPTGVYTIEIDPNGGLFRNSPNVYKANYYKNSVVDLSEIDRLYYKFINWTVVDSDETLTGNSLTVTKNIKLKANWEYGPYYKVVIDPNGGIYNGSTKPFQTKIKEGDVLDVASTTREGYVFYKWEEISNSASFLDNKITMGRRDVYLRARWEGIYTLTFDLAADDALCSVVSKEVTNMFAIGSLPTPQRDGYVFDGWYIDNNKIEPTTLFTKDQDATAVAHWTARSDTKYTVNHWKQKPRTNPDLKPDSYSLEKKETLEGVTDTEVEPDVLNIEGYDTPDKVKITILGNGKRVVDYYYYVKRYEIQVSVNEGIKEIRYKINGSDEYKSTTSTTTLKAEFNTNYSLYAISKEGWYYNETSESHPRTGIVSVENVPFSPNASKCPAGYSCNPGSNEPEVCPAGTFAIAESGECSTCPAGTHASNAGSDHCDTCPAGTKCGGGSTDPETCPAGTYAVEGSGECTSCPPGQHASSAGSDHCDTCPAGTACGGGSSEPTVCPKGTYAVSEGSAKCEACSEGKYASLPGSTSCTICPKGSKCSKPTPPPTPTPTVPEVGPVGPETCPAGTYALEGSKECTSCPAGMHASNAGSDHCDTCPAGTKCSGGSKDPETCPAGTYAVEGSGECTSCPAGTHASNAGSDHCDTCPAGTKCSGGSKDPETCPAGTYALEGSGECKKCPGGTYSSSAGSDHCDVCPAGTQCGEGSKNPTACPTGTYSNSSGTISCYSCPSGTYASSTGSTSCSTCPAGSMCPRGSSNPQTCADGYYQNSSGASTCYSCSSGYYSNSSTGKTSCARCPDGYTSGTASSYCWGIPYVVNIAPYNSTASNFATANVQSLTVRYNSNNSFVITPRIGYYITSIECTDGYTNRYTETYLNDGVSSSNYNSTVTIYNPGVKKDGTCYYHISQITASMINYKNSTYTTCTNVQCALDELYGKLK